MSLQVEDDSFYLQAAQMLEDEWAQARNEELKRDQNMTGIREADSAAEFQPSNVELRSTETVTVTHPAIAPGHSHLSQGGIIMPPSTQLDAPAKKRGRPAIKGNENVPPPSSAKSADAAIKQKKPRSKAAIISAPLSEQPTTASLPTVVARVANAKNFSSASVSTPSQALRADLSVVHASNLQAAAPPAVPCTQLVNRAGAPVAPGHSWPDALYCGRPLGHSVLPGSDGRCGPSSGPQCADCRFSFPAGAPAPAALVCSGRHAMFFYVFNSSSVLKLSHSCDVCKSKIMNGSVGLRCTRCDYDVCCNCLQSQSGQNSNPETAARVFPLVASNSTLISLQLELKLRSAFSMVPATHLGCKKTSKDELVRALGVGSILLSLTPEYKAFEKIKDSIIHEASSRAALQLETQLRAEYVRRKEAEVTQRRQEEQRRIAEQTKQENALKELAAYNAALYVHSFPNSHSCLLAQFNLVRRIDIQNSYYDACKRLPLIDYPCCLGNSISAEKVEWCSKWCTQESDGFTCQRCSFYVCSNCAQVSNESTVQAQREMGLKIVKQIRMAREEEERASTAARLAAEKEQRQRQLERERRRACRKKKLLKLYPERVQNPPDANKARSFKWVVWQSQFYGFQRYDPPASREFDSSWKSLEDANKRVRWLFYGLVGAKSRYLDEEMSSWSGSGGESVAGEDGRGEEESYDAVGALQLHLQVYKGAYTVSAQV